HGPAPPGHRFPEEHVPVRRPGRVARRSDARPRPDRAVRIGAVMRCLVLLSFAVFGAGLLAQDGFDRDAYARDHVKFLIDQLAQWTKDFPQAYNAALLKPPVDASKLSEAAKAGGEEFGESVKRLVAFRDAKDLQANAGFRN